VLVDGKPVRASKRSAAWCLQAIDRCWANKAPRIQAAERPPAEKAYDEARAAYRRILADCVGE
jgi:hypothetical protein